MDRHHSRAKKGSPPQVRGKRRLLSLPEAICRITPAGAGKTQGRNVIAGINGDHPRRCGENSSSDALSPSLAGSPPQVRGKRPHLGGFFCAHRITPAGAGKTCRNSKYRQVKKDHPRRCGENYSEEIEMEKIKGSPPQVRGKLFGKTSERERRRITPAGAGKTLSPSPYTAAVSNHPRRCGENLLTYGYNSSNMGSPPQVRGKLF